jgi:hypothetical protein
LLEVFSLHGMEKVQNLNSTEMLTDYCYELKCILFSTNSPKFDDSFLKNFLSTKVILGENFRVGIILNFESFKKSLNLKSTNEVLLILNMRKKEFRIYNQNDYTKESLKKWISMLPKLKIEKYSNINLSSSPTPTKK